MDGRIFDSTPCEAVCLRVRGCIALEGGLSLKWAEQILLIERKIYGKIGCCNLEIEQRAFKGGYCETES